MIKIKVIPSKLTDGSVVHDVHVVEHGAARIVLNGYDRENACALAQKLSDAIMQHSTAEARWFEVDLAVAA